jgi:uncharacterized protein YjbJ (UPF0337 family)
MANDDQVKGKWDNLKGRVKEAAGAVSGDKKLEAEGAVERAKGAVQKKAGDVEEKIERKAAPPPDDDED